MSESLQSPELLKIPNSCNIHRFLYSLANFNFNFFLIFPFLLTMRSVFLASVFLLLMCCEFGVQITEFSERWQDGVTCGIGKCFAELQELRIIQVQEEQVIFKVWNSRLDLETLSQQYLMKARRVEPYFQISEEKKIRLEHCITIQIVFQM